MVIEDLTPNGLLSYYLMSSYLYYLKDGSPLTDPEFDLLCTLLKKSWKEVTHPHKGLVNYKALSSQTGFYIAKYPNIVKMCAYEWSSEGGLINGQ